VDKDTVKGILAKYSPPLSPGQMDEIAEAIVYEWSQSLKVPAAETSKPRSSRSPVKVKARQGRT
jgi:hypothetical protein